MAFARVDVPISQKRSKDLTQHFLTEIISTNTGPVQGFIDEGMQKFLGIPYAEPPIGELRWLPPVTPRLWQQPLNATSFGPVCAQTSECFPGFASDSVTEDCLYLNVFTPLRLDTNRKLPVIVWVHGGGFAGGASNDYNPALLVGSGNIIFVSLNYRVGVFGFFSHPAINAENHPRGNYGIMDQQAAFNWVQRNIANFGGDASNITAFGESAGGASIMAHLAADSSRGLFRKAIIESGGSPVTIRFPTIEKLEAMGIALAEAANCTHQTPQNLRRISAQDFIQANKLPEGAFGVGKFPFGLMEDGQIVPKNLRERFLNGNFNRLPLLIGVNRDEFAWFQAMMELRSKKIVTTEVYAETVVKTIVLLNKLHLNGLTIPSDAIPEILEKYSVEGFDSPSRALAALVGDGLISTSGRRATRIIAKHVQEVYAYEFDVPDTPSPWPDVSFPYGSAHTLELLYIFPGFRGASGKYTTFTEPQQRLAETMAHYWTTFAWRGTPNDEVPTLPTWDSYNSASDNVILLQAAQPVEMIKDRGARHNSDYWDKFY